MDGTDGTKKPRTKINWGCLGVIAATILIDGVVVFAVLKLLGIV